MSGLAFPMYLLPGYHACNIGEILKSVLVTPLKSKAKDILLMFRVKMKNV